MATTKNAQGAKKITWKKNEGKKTIKPYCEQAEKAAIYKAEADRLRPAAAKELQAKLDADPETKDFTGTVVYLCDDKIYKVRIQRPDNTPWRKKTIKVLMFLLPILIPACNSSSPTCAQDIG